MFIEKGLEGIQNLVKDYTIFVVRHIFGEGSSQKRNEELANYIKLHNLKAVAIMPGLEGRLHESRCTRADHIKIIESFPLVIRNYWAFDCIGKSNVMIAPLMVKQPNRNIVYDNIYQNTPPVHERDFVWCFYSSMHATPKRDIAVKYMLQLNSTHPQYKFSLDYRNIQHNCNITRNTGKKRKRGDMSYEIFYHQSLHKSIFGLSPEGNSPETWRFYEIMERGSIPIVMTTTFNNYYRHVFPCNFTQYLVASHDPANAVADLMSDLNALEQRRKALVVTYNTWRNDWQFNIGARIDAVGSGRPPVVSNLKWDYNSCFESFSSQ